MSITIMGHRPKFAQMREFAACGPGCGSGFASLKLLSDNGGADISLHFEDLEAVKEFGWQIYSTAARQIGDREVRSLEQKGTSKECPS
jgi:hypothetical protein